MDSERAVDDAHVLHALGSWYSGNPRVRRACAFRGREDEAGIPENRVLHVFLDVEPVMDSDEIFPIWLAHSRAWESQLEAATGCSVRLGYLRPDDFALPLPGLQPFLLDIWLREDWGT